MRWQLEAGGIVSIKDAKVIALDFDGLLVDALNECVLVSWNAHHQLGIEQFSDEGLSQIPPAFMSKFKNHRCFSKHLRHFFMAFQSHVGYFESQADFDAVYASLDAVAVDQFSQRVLSYRQAVRQIMPERWRSFHHFYPGMVDLMRQVGVPICIVSAKDSDSVQELLQHADIHIADDRIYGECRDKVWALDDICARFSVLSRDVGFFDDNVLNAADAYFAGFRAHWAVWGYRAPCHALIAKGCGLPQATLADMSAWQAVPVC